MKLTKEEVAYMWTKLETHKKKKTIAAKNALYDLFHSDKTSFTTEEFTSMIKSLEFSFRKRLEGSKDDLTHPLFLSIKAKIPADMIIVKMGSIDRKPSKSSSKNEIQKYLKRKGIDFDEKATKAQLLGLFENMNIKTFEGFTNNLDIKNLKL